MRWRRRHLTAALLIWLAGCSLAQPEHSVPSLMFERTIALPETKGRIDHLAIDLAARRLIVAEIANGTVDIVDLAAGRVAARIAGLSEPQDAAWLPASRQLVVACADGTVRFYDADRREIARIDLGDDADNVRVDRRNGHVLVGYGKGGLATIDPASHLVLARLPLPGHPEGFQLAGTLVYINVPGDGSIIVADIDAGRQVARWPTGLQRLNFPMAVDPEGQSIRIAYRLPAGLATIDAKSGETLSLKFACGDADDLFVAGNRTMVICGTGHIDIIDGDGRRERVETQDGARTGLYVPELKRLFVAVPARGQPAAVWVFKQNFPGGR